MRIPFFRSSWQSQQNLPAILDTVTSLLSSGSYILGKEVKAFEDDLAQYLGVEEVIGVNSGTDALLLALMTFAVGVGDEVIVPGYTFFSCLETIVRTGATPVLVDNAPGSFLPDADRIVKCITSKTKAIIGVPLFGNPTMTVSISDLCRQNNIYFIEDAAQACGAFATLEDGRQQRVGSLADASAFSFYPTKTLGGAGDGGAVCFSNNLHAQKCRLLRNHALQQGMHIDIGLNSRLDELQACLLRLGLKDLNKNLMRRKEIISRYINAWKDIKDLVLPNPVPGHAWNYFVVCHPKRDLLIKELALQGVETKIYYKYCLHQQPGFQKRFGSLSLPNAEKQAMLSFALPLFSEMEDFEVDYTIRILKQACKKVANLELSTVLT